MLGGQIGEDLLTDFSRFAKFLACPLDATSLSVWEEKLVCEKKT
jgi:hypothetical protein